jgi:hypothetical protein
MGDAGRTRRPARNGYRNPVSGSLASTLIPAVGPPLSGLADHNREPWHYRYNLRICRATPALHPPLTAAVPFPNSRGTRGQGVSSRHQEGRHG